MEPLCCLNVNIRAEIISVIFRVHSIVLTEDILMIKERTLIDIATGTEVVYPVILAGRS